MRNQATHNRMPTANRRANATFQWSRTVNGRFQVTWRLMGKLGPAVWGMQGSVRVSLVNNDDWRQQAATKLRELRANARLGVAEWACRKVQP